jgi:hypothetical protein
MPRIPIGSIQPPTLSRTMSVVPDEISMPKPTLSRTMSVAPDESIMTKPTLSRTMSVAPDESIMTKPTLSRTYALGYGTDCSNTSEIALGLNRTPFQDVSTIFTNAHLEASPCTSSFSTSSVPEQVCQPILKRSTFGRFHGYTNPSEDPEKTQTQSYCKSVPSDPVPFPCKLVERTPSSGLLPPEKDLNRLPSVEISVSVSEEGEEGEEREGED